MQASENTLPFPPSDEQKFSYVERRVWLLNFFAVSGFAAVAYSTILFSALDDALWPFFALLGAAAAGFLLSIQPDLFSRDFDDEEHRRRVAAWSCASRHYPSADLFLPICGEDRSVLLNAWRHVLALDYPRLTVYCLDAGGDETMRSVAEELGFGYLRRERPGWSKKAGNLQFAYENSCGEFILILDADFPPAPTACARRCPTSPPSRTWASCKPPSSSPPRAGRTGSSAARARYRSCSTASHRCHGTAGTRRSASVLTRFASWDATDPVRRFG